MVMGGLARGMIDLSVKMGEEDTQSNIQGAKARFGQNTLNCHFLMIRNNHDSGYNSGQKSTQQLSLYLESNRRSRDTWILQLYSPSRPSMRFTTSLLVAASTLFGATLAHNIQLQSHSRECFHEQLHKDDKMTVTFQIGDREFGSAGNLDVDFWVGSTGSPGRGACIDKRPDHQPRWRLRDTSKICFERGSLIHG